MERFFPLPSYLPQRLDEITLFSSELLNLETDAVHVYPMCWPDFEQVRIIGQGFDKPLVADEVLTKVPPGTGNAR